MRIKYCSFICLIFFLGCDINNYSVTKNEIPVPTSETIAYLNVTIENSYSVRISNNNYTDSYQITPYFASMLDWSPDKKWIIYTWLNKIWKMYYNGSGKIPLTPANIEAQGARFSPDGRRIVFGITRENGRGFDVFIMGENGKNIERLTSDSLVSKDGEYLFAWPDWSPDGKRIVFKYNRIDTTSLQEHIGILDLSTHKFATLSYLDPLQPFQPRWSPIRNELLCTTLLSVEDGGTDIFRINLNTKETMRLTFSGKSRWPEWNSDGDRFLFTDYINGHPIIWEMRRDGTGVKQIIIGDNKYALSPSW